MCKIDRWSRTLGPMAELAAEIIRRFLLRLWQSKPDGLLEQVKGIYLARVRVRRSAPLLTRPN